MNYSSALQTLAYCSRTDCNEPSPEGCTIITVSDKCEVHLLLKGLIEPAKEITKAQKKIEFLQGKKEKLEKAISAADYESKVPREIRQANEETLNQTSAELVRLAGALQALKLM